ncbi:hypothetical protein TIFTF001_022452 [Ficus carica]|uniref:C2 domain-containing protein n=1 Tax=Ficus carica TaxID=3494 RepID=A0AA88AJZ5_FICCA|nr:hypothetical protein TIFTF001_022452 [Ficus carica]
MSILNPFQLLELNVISAQDLAPVSRSMRTYAVAWVHPDRKLSTRVDTHGQNNPTWNDKFVFRVDEDFLHADTSAVMIEIYALHWFKDVHVGTVRILVGNLIPSPPRPGSSYHSHFNQLGMRFVALQVRRPSGRPQGILNIGVAILHSAMRSMPLYSQLSTSAVGYRELMGEEDPIHHLNSTGTPQSNSHVLGILAELRRTKSDTSSMIGSEIRAREFRSKGKGGKSSSMVSGSETASKQRRSKGRSKGSSVISSSGGGSEVGKKAKGKKGKASSLVNGNSEVVVDPPKKGKIGKASSLINGSDVLSVGPDPPKKSKIRKVNSLISGSDILSIGMDPPKKEKIEKVNSLINGSDILSVGMDPPKKGKIGKVSSIINGNSEVDEECFPPKRVVEVKPILKPFVATEAFVPVNRSPKVKPSPRFNLMDRGNGPYRATPQRRQQGKSPFHPNKFQSPYEYETPRKSALTGGGGGMVFLTESELGPSPSEVAAALAKQPADETESSIVGGWSMDESIEGLRSKLERWRTELPPVYDRGEFSSYPSSESRHNRRHTDGGNGLFSCFSNICGVECSIVCGSGSVSGSKKSSSERIIRSPSADNINYK